VSSVSFHVPPPPRTSRRRSGCERVVCLRCPSRIPRSSRVQVQPRDRLCQTRRRAQLWRATSADAEKKNALVVRLLAGVAQIEECSVLTTTSLKENYRHSSLHRLPRKKNRRLRLTSRFSVHRKRGQISQIACDFCRDRRKKCSGDRPSCSNCVKRGMACSYVSNPRKRKGGRPPKGIEDNTDTVMSSGDSARKGDDTADEDGNKSRSPSPSHHLPIHERFPGKGLGKNDAAYNRISDSPCTLCIEYEIPCTGTRPTCLNCLRRARTCHYANTSAPQSAVTSTSPTSEQVDPAP